MNSVVLKGRITADPELKQTPSNISVCRFTIAVDKFAKAGEEKKADFIRCTAWRNTAEFLSKYFAKGQEICVHGELHNADYTDNNGVKHYAMDVTVDRAEFCGSKAGNANGGGNYDAPGTPDLTDGFEEILSDGDVPF